MAFMQRDLSDPFGSGRPVNHTRRTWSNNGVNYTVEESSWTGPGFSFTSTSGSTLSRAQTFNDGQPQPQRARGGGDGILGTALNLIGGMISGQPTDRRRVQSTIDDGLAYDDRRRSSNRSAPSQRQQAQLSNGRSQRRQAPPERGHHQGSSAHRRDTEDPRARSHSHNFSQPSQARRRSAYVDEYTDSEDSDDSDTPDNEELVNSLQQVAEHHTQQRRVALMRLQQAKNQFPRNLMLESGLAEEFQQHQQAEKSALEDLEYARSTARQPSRQQSTARSRPPPRRAQTGADPLFSNDFESFFRSPGLDAGFHARAGIFNAQAPFSNPAFADINQMFEELQRASRGPRMASNVHAQFFATGVAPQTPFNTGQQGPRFATGNGFTGTQQRAGPTGFVPQPQSQPQPQAPPTTSLRPEEAARLYQTYSDRWAALAPTDPNIPFPTRGLKASALTSRNTLWAPTVSAPIATWSDEVVMKANTQAFFLGAAGLSPRYSETVGAKIELGFVKGGVPAAKIKVLVDMLKKERTRWHSDRLGKRNGGSGVTNGALQGDERARAVYHGVCELIEEAAM